MKLLLAEDNELNADIAETLLTDAGAHVTIVENGKKALDCFEAAPPGTFDAILMDVMMPVMDGLARDTRDPGDSTGGCKADSDSCHDGKCL
ncbi:MAG: response regulator [Clostridium fessum]